MTFFGKWTHPILMMHFNAFRTLWQGEKVSVMVYISKAYICLQVITYVQAKRKYGHHVGPNHLSMMQ